MNHQPFEEWLLSHTQLDPGQKRELESHVRTCPHCAALLKTGKVLRDLHMASPASGFVARFETRLAAYQAADRRRRLTGLIFFVSIGMTLMLWSLLPVLSGFLTSPAGWIAALVEWGLFLITTLQASLQAGAVILDVLGGLLPPFAWMVMVSGAAGIGLLWSISIWRFALRGIPQGV